MSTKPVAIAPSPPSPTLSDMEHDFELDIELGSQGTPGRSPPLVPSPGEDGPLVPPPPIITPPSQERVPDAEIKAALAPVLSGIRRRNVGRIYAGAEDLPGRGLPVMGRKGCEKRSPDDMYWATGSEAEKAAANRMLNDRVQNSFKEAHSEHTTLVHPFSRLSVSSTKPKSKPKVSNQASARMTSESGPVAQQKKVENEGGPITRFLPPNKCEAFIAFMPHTAEATIALAKLQCPSLSTIPSAELSLALHYDGSPTWVKDVLFRVMPDTWPQAVTGQLPLIHIRHIQPASSLRVHTRDDTAATTCAGRTLNEDLMGAFDDDERNNAIWKSGIGLTGDGIQFGQVQEARTRGGSKQEEKLEAKTWGQLVKEGALLGVPDEDFSSRMPDFGLY